jgi:Uma2 family endonuclease
VNAIATFDLAAPAPAAENGADALYEIVNGQYLELPPISAYASRIATLLAKCLEVFAEAHQLGRVIGEALFALNPSGKLRRRPDVAFVSYGRWARNRPLPDTDPWAVVPDLAVEVVSPNDLAEGLRIKVHEYFQAGVQQVWVVYPKLALVDVYESTALMGTRTRSEEIGGEPVLPGLRLPVASLFEEASEPAAE